MKPPRNLFRKCGQNRKGPNGPPLVVRAGTKEELEKAKGKSMGEERYMPQIQAMHDQNLHGIQRPGLHMVEIRHDPDCRRPQGQPCTCNPDVGIAGDPQTN
jgi:hypothetical protein